MNANDDIDVTTQSQTLSTPQNTLNCFLTVLKQHHDVNIDFVEYTSKVHFQNCQNCNELRSHLLIPGSIYRSDSGLLPQAHLVSQVVAPACSDSKLDVRRSAAKIELRVYYSQ